MERGLRSSVLAAYDRLPSVHMFGADRVRTQLNVHLVALTQIERLGPREKRLPEDVSFPGERRVREGDAVGPLPVEPGTDAVSGAALGDLLSQAKTYGGLGFGSMMTSVIFLAVIIGLVAIAQRNASQTAITASPQ